MGGGLWAAAHPPLCKGYAKTKPSP